MVQRYNILGRYTNQCLCLCSHAWPVEVSHGKIRVRPTLASPTISGTTPFAETTSVSISGPDGAEIHYTTDGNTPTAESTLYSEAFTLSDTTTVKAISIKDGESSEVASKLFTKGEGDDEMDQN